MKNRIKMTKKHPGGNARKTSFPFLTFCLAAAMLLGGIAPSQAQQSRLKRLQQHLYFLASDSLQGRLAGSEGGLKARQYIVGQYESIGLQPYRDSMLHTFTTPMQANAIRMGDLPKQNIVALIPGSDPQLREEYIVLGAHYDHVGVKNGSVYNGADDNASGSTALIEIARELYARRGELKRSVIIAAFDAEEEGLYGSKALVKELTDNGDIDKVKLMMSIDMVGWYQATGALTLEGSGTLSGADALMKRLAGETGLEVDLKGFEKSLFTATDTEPFAVAQCPTLAVTTGLKSPYHKPEDDADLIDYQGLDLICQYLSQLTLCWANGSEPLESSGKVARKHRGERSLFEAGVGVGLGSARMGYPHSNLTGRSGFGGAVGFMGRWNMGEHVALQADVLFNLYRLPHPDVDGTVLDVFEGGAVSTFSNVTIPLTLLFCTGSREVNNGYIGLGVFYSPMFNADHKFQNDFLAGPQWRIGLRTYPFDISVVTMYNINSVESATLPTMHSVHTLVVLSYVF